MVEALCDGDSPVFEVWDEKVTIDTDVSLDAFVLRAVAGDIASDICGIAIAVRVRQ